MQSKQMHLTKTLVICAMLVALNVILSRMFAVNTQFLKVSFGFVPLVAAGMFFGPLWGCAVAGVADVIGAILFPVAAYFPGFTLSSALMGLCYGALLYQKPDRPFKPWELSVRAIVAVLLIGVFLEQGMNNVFLYYLYKNGLWGMLPMRIIKTLTMMPVKYLGIVFLGAPRNYLVRRRYSV